MSLIPLLAQRSTSEDLIRRDEFVISGWFSPRPEQKSFKPPPDPVLSTIGVLNFVVRPKFSATVVAKGYTVEDPTIFI